MNYQILRSVRYRSCGTSRPVPCQVLASGATLFMVPELWEYRESYASDYMDTAAVYASGHVAIRIQINVYR